MVKLLNRYSGGKANGSRGFGGLNGCRGLTRVEVTVVIVCIVIILIFLLLLPAREHARYHAIRAACQSNLQQVGQAYRTWEGDHGDKSLIYSFSNSGSNSQFGAASNVFRYFLTMTNELPNPWVLNCPSDERDGAPDFAYFSGKNLSYFIGIDIGESHPSMWLAGDRNLVTNGTDAVPGLIALGTNITVGWSAKMHKFVGNSVLTDGSVQLTSSALLQTFLSNTGTNITRLAVP